MSLASRALALAMSRLSEDGGTVNGDIDMDGHLILDAANLQEVGIRFLFLDVFGADPTGTNDSTQAFKDAQDLAGSDPYVLIPSPNSIYKLGSGGAGDIRTFGRKQGILGPGESLCSLKYYGNGTCINAYDSSFSSSSSIGGPMKGFGIDLSTAGSSAVGFQWGNLLRADVEVTVISGVGANNIGFLLKNGASAWSEGGNWRCRAIGNTNNVVFDGGSYDYSKFDWYIYAASGQNGVTLQNGAYIDGGVPFIIRGNFSGGAGNTAWVLGLDPAGAGSGTSHLTGMLFIDVEADGSGTGHITFSLHGSSSCQLRCIGEFMFRNGGIAFTGYSRGSGPTLSIAGLISEPTMGSMSGTQSFSVYGSQQRRVSGSLSNPSGSALAISINNADLRVYQLANNAVTVTFSGTPPSGKELGVEQTFFFKQPSSGTPGVPSWPANVKWRGGNHTFSTANNAIDKVHLIYTPADDVWFAELDLAYA